MSSGWLVESFEDVGVDVLAVGLAACVGVVVLVLEGVAEGDGGGEEAAGFADGLSLIHISEPTRPY